MQHWEPVDAECPFKDSHILHEENGEQVAGTSTAGSSVPRLVRTKSGMSKILGIREGEWFKQWESTIATAVRSRMQDNLPLTVPYDIPTTRARINLDGY